MTYVYDSWNFFNQTTGQVIKAWDIGVASMKIGEVCRLTCQSDYAYGQRGSPPKIPPQATLIFEVNCNFHKHDKFCLFLKNNLKLWSY